MLVFICSIKYIKFIFYKILYICKNGINFKKTIKIGKFEKNIKVGKLQKNKKLEKIYKNILTKIGKYSKIWNKKGEKF